MKVFIVYCHPSEDSFTARVRDSFIKGVVESGNDYEISDLYKMDFKTDMSEAEYLRESNYRADDPIEDDVLSEQKKINGCDVLAFIYPVFWTEAPAKLVGWFSRVWTYGFAYGNKTMKKLRKALVLCVAGNTVERLEQFGHIESMKKVMLGDRLYNRAEETEFTVFGGMTKAEPELREKQWENYLRSAYASGKNSCNFAKACGTKAGN